MKEKKDYNPKDYKPKAKGGFGRGLFMVIGIIAVIILLIIIGAIIAIAIIKPYGIDVTKLPGIMMGTDQSGNYDHPLLSTQQEILLRSVGIDPASLPTTITPAMEQCAISALGADRVKAIQAGATPTMNDYLKAKSCF